MSVEFTDNSDAWAKAIVESCNDGLTAAAGFAADAIRGNLGSEGGRAIAISNTIKGSKRRRYRKLADGESVGKREGRRVWEAAPPGKFPGVRTGAMRNSIQSTKSVNLVAYVGSTMSGKDNYPLFLETGWERRKPLTPKQLKMLHALRREMNDAGIATINHGGAKGGTIHARPWLRRTIREQGPRIAKQFEITASESLAARMTR